MYDGKTVDPTKPVRTVEDKLPVRLLCTDRKDEVHPWCGLVERRDGIEDLWVWNEEGAYSRHKKHFYDLENVPEKRTVELVFNCYRARVHVFETRKAADVCSNSHRQACIVRTIEYEVGEGLDQ